MINRETNPDDFWRLDREYTVWPGALVSSGNTLAVKVENRWSKGGIIGYNIRSMDIIPAKQELVKKEFIHLRFLNSYYRYFPIPLDDPYRYVCW